jgi:hypothetical protein
LGSWLIGLSQHGGDVNAEDLAQQTALHWAAVRGATSVTDVLLESGARLEAADVNGYRVCNRFVFLNLSSPFRILCSVVGLLVSGCNSSLIKARVLVPKAVLIIV